MSAPLTRDQMIDRIFQIVPPGNVAAAKKNYDKLSDKEIGERLKRLEAAEVSIKRAVKKYRPHHRRVEPAQ